ncbi:DUF1127 domain-containing protein [Alsobacter metallidurans]|nr:DUF1127 domain-containing protein [Alsobacter metallidurans]
MTAPAQQALAPSFTGAGALVARVAVAWKRWRNRQQVAELLSLDDHLLADLGVARGDVFEALAHPPARDCSASLGAAATRARQEETMRLRESLRSARILSLPKAGIQPAAAAGAAPAAQVGHAA